MTSGLPAPPPLTRTVLAEDERARPAASMRSAISDKRDFLSPGQRHGNPVQKGLSSRASPVSSTSIDSAHTVVTLLAGTQAAVAAVQGTSRGTARPSPQARQTREGRGAGFSGKFNKKRCSLGQNRRPRAG